ncbi:acyl-CoA synthetase [Pseudovibrio sp. Tun.PSC04-5.I4]|uniref:acyl-CoA synthetase n=1 Tax=Pseudovibrio sp. Tun.PSC04-5.I4 TaxID=1798213 RepID=UPI00088F266D|nr:acyl-CoA synthetase [Pseudovibrio sp. Tun.PSC04-5.I4]SDR30294.1 acetyl-CoA synthetase [Pseudovibrio sp. Tun.PSC04-5.I4]
MLPSASTYEELCEKFEWDVPEYYNIGVDICDKWADVDPAREALIFAEEGGKTTSYSFQNLKDLSNKLANLLSSHGVEKGDRVGILLPQAPETAYSHIAIHKLGGISIPLFTLFGEEALEYRLENSGAKALITNNVGAAKLAQIRSALPELELILNIDGPEHGTIDFHAELAKQSTEFTPLKTKAEDPAIIIYTSGTTGQPKGALHAHRTLLGHLPGVELPHNFFPQEGDRFWTPADWAWIGGLIDVLLPSLHHGVPVVACRFKKFTGEAAFQLLQDQKIRNAFIPPTALKMMRQVENPQDRWDYKLRSLGSGGEALGAELIQWGHDTFDLNISEFYGQTECNLVVCTCAEIMEIRPGVTGKATPGFDVQIVNNDGIPQETGMLGNIGIRAPAPVMFLEYWKNPEATKNKFAGGFLLTGDKGVKDKDGWIQFVGRDDDVITSSGYRIGPGEIEDCLLKHQAVGMAGVIGKPDQLRTEIVKAYVVLRDGIEPTDQLAKELAQFVKQRLAAHEYPREVEFVEALPMTTTGKVIRRELRARAVDEEI